MALDKRVVKITKNELFGLDDANLPKLMAERLTKAFVEMGLKVEIKCYEVDSDLLFMVECDLGASDDKTSNEETVEACFNCIFTQTEITKLKKLVQ